MTNLINKLCPANIPNIDPYIQNLAGYGFAGNIYDSTFSIILGVVFLIMLWVTLTYTKTEHKIKFKKWEVIYTLIVLIIFGYNFTLIPKDKVKPHFSKQEIGEINKYMGLIK